MRPRNFDTLCKTLIYSRKRFQAKQTKLEKFHFNGFQLIHLFTKTMPQTSKKLRLQIEKLNFQNNQRTQINCFPNYHSIQWPRTFDTMAEDIRYNGRGLMVWGYIRSNGESLLIPIRSKVDSDEILKDVLDFI